MMTPLGTMMMMKQTNPKAVHISLLGVCVVGHYFWCHELCIACVKDKKHASDQRTPNLESSNATGHHLPAVLWHKAGCAKVCDLGIKV